MCLKRRTICTSFDDLHGGRGEGSLEVRSGLDDLVDDLDGAVKQAARL